MAISSLANLRGLRLAPDVVSCSGGNPKNLEGFKVEAVEIGSVDLRLVWWPVTFSSRIIHWIFLLRDLGWDAFRGLQELNTGFLGVLVQDYKCFSTIVYKIVRWFCTPKIEAMGCLQGWLRMTWIWHLFFGEMEWWNIPVNLLRGTHTHTHDNTTGTLEGKLS